jgi:glutamate-1-semialdehyde 2,1-aminomutase
VSLFVPKPTRSGPDLKAGRQGDMETLLHVFFINEGTLVTPFRTMPLMCPVTSVEDMESVLVADGGGRAPTQNRAV